MKLKLFAVLMAICLLFAGCSNAKQPDNKVTEVTTESQAVNVTGGMVEQSQTVDKSYFDDAAFVGDSVSLKLNYYCKTTGDLGKAKFFTSGSLGAANALWELSRPDSVHPSYQGEKMLIEDCVAASGAKKVFIMLGMNDIGLYTMEESIENYVELISRIKLNSPDCVIFVQSMTPITKGSQRAGESLNNDKIKQYNKMLLQMCIDNGWSYLDIASVMYDESGEALNETYCSDKDTMGMHFTNEGCSAWIEYLKTHALNAENYPVQSPEAVG